LAEDGFEIFVTVDRNLPHQQNLETLPVTIFVLCAIDNRREILNLLVPKLLERLDEPNLQGIIEIW
jgi:hypothetical protein